MRYRDLKHWAKEGTVVPLTEEALPPPPPEDLNKRELAAELRSIIQRLARLRCDTSKPAIVARRQLYERERELKAQLRAA